VVNLIQDESLSQLPILAGDIAKATESDATLNQVMKLTKRDGHYQRTNSSKNPILTSINKLS